MGKYSGFEELKCWQAARSLNITLYKITSTKNVCNDFSYRNQIRKASISIMSNIAEGYSRRSNKDFIRFLTMALGSCYEIRSLLYVALDLNYLKECKMKALFEQTEKIKALILGLIKFLDAKE